MRKIKWCRYLAAVLCLPAAVLYGRESVFRESPFFPIVGYNMLWQADEEMIAEQADMGLTLVTIATLDELSWCQKYGIRGILCNPGYNRFLDEPASPELKPTLKADLAKFGQSPALYGIQIADEPGKKDMPGFEKMLATVNELQPGLQSYCNLFPDYSVSAQHGFGSYDDYVKTYIGLYKKYASPLVCYDNYANKDGKLSASEQQAAFLRNLETIRRLTLAEAVPFWVTLLSASHDYFPDPNEADINFAVFASLAYGAKGIGYFTTNSHPAFAFQGGPFDALKEKTPLWRYIRDCNYRVRALGGYLNRLESTGVFYSQAPGDFNRLPGRLVKNLTCDRSISSFLVGEFRTGDGGNYVMVVNLNLDSTAHFTAEMVKGHTLQAINSYTGSPASNDTWLRPGQGKLYQVIAE